MHKSYNQIESVGYNIRGSVRVPVDAAVFALVAGENTKKPAAGSTPVRSRLIRI